MQSRKAARSKAMGSMSPRGSSSSRSLVGWAYPARRSTRSRASWHSPSSQSENNRSRIFQSRCGRPAWVHPQPGKEAPGPPHIGRCSNRAASSPRQLSTGNRQAPRSDGRHLPDVELPRAGHCPVHGRLCQGRLSVQAARLPRCALTPPQKKPQACAGGKRDENPNRNFCLPQRMAA